jgi:transposase-like protein
MTPPRPDFPRSLPEFIQRFSDESCFRFVAECRWPGGKFVCPRCGHDEGYVLSKRWGFHCARRSCRHSASVTAGTVMHKSRQSLATWLLAAWLVATDKRGISAAHLQRQLGLSRYETAFQMLHRLRAAMVAPDRTLLSGTVEVDESELGSPPRGRKESPEKMIVVGAVEVRLNADTGRHYPGRIRLRYLPEGRSKLDLLGFVVETVEEGSAVVTDGLGSYTDVPLVGYTRSIESKTQGMKPDEVLRHYHLAISNLKAWIAGTHHGGISAKHLQAYLNEYAYRFNRRGNVFAAFQRLLGIATQVRGPEYDQLYAAAGEMDGWEHPDPAGREAPATKRVA